MNFLCADFPIDYVFMGNSKRYSQFFSRIYSGGKAKLICTSNITEAKEKVDYVVNFANLKSDVDAIYDNPLVLLTNLAAKVGVGSITLAGFDGYSDDVNSCYYSDYVKLLYDKSGISFRNGALKEFIASAAKRVPIKTITPSKYF